MVNLPMRLLESLAFQVGCPFATWVAAGSLALQAGSTLGLFGNNQPQQSADKSGAYYDQLAQISADDYATWKAQGLPLLQSLATSAQEDRTQQETEFAAGAAKDSAVASRSAAMRDLNLTGGTGTDRAAALLGPSYMDEAGKVAGAITGARRNEQTRRFNEGTQAANLYRGIGAQAVSGYNAAAGGESALAGRYSQIYGDQANAISQLGYSGAVLSRNASRWFGSSPNSNANYNPDGTIGNPTSYGDTYSLADPAYGKDGGVLTRRGFRRSYADGGGVINGPGTGTSDSIRARSRPGSYILSADTVRAIGHKKVHQMIEQAGVRPGEGATSYNGVPVRVSNGEAEIPPEAVRYHGEEYFNKLQQKYHRPVMDDDDGHANGGAIRKRGLPRSVEDAIYRAMPEQAIGRRIRARA